MPEQVRIFFISLPGEKKVWAMHRAKKSTLPSHYLCKQAKVANFQKAILTSCHHPKNEQNYFPQTYII